MIADNKQVPFLDGFRAYAILLVIFGHLFKTYVVFAQLGVTLFFFVSGFLITKLLIAEFNSSQTISLRKFYFRRFLRLYPALIFMLTITSIIVVSYGYKIIVPELMAGLFYYTNYYRIYFFVSLPAENYPSPGLLWSLAVEEHFYVVFPVLFILMFSWNNKRFTYLIYLLLILFIFIRLYTFTTTIETTLMERKIYMLTHCRGDSILFGCLSAILLYRSDAQWYKNILRSKYTFFVGVFLLLSTQLIPGAFFQSVLKFTFQGVSFGLMIPTFLYYNGKNLLLRMLDNQPAIIIGKLSYSLYLFHWVALAFCNLYFPEKSHNWYIMFGIMATLLSLISYYFVERPFLQLRKRFGSNAIS